MGEGSQKILNSMGQHVADSHHDLLALLVAQLDDFVVVFADEEGRFQSWHPGVGKIFGFGADEFIGRHIEILFPPAERLKGTPGEELRSARATGRASDSRWLVRKSGEPIFVEGVTIGLRFPDGQAAGYGKIMRDVTARKHTEDELRTFSGALDQSPVIVRSWDGIIQHWTTGCEHLYGWCSEAAVGKLCQDLLQTKFTVPLEEIEEQLRTQGSWKGELEHTRADGAILAISAFWVAMQDATGQTSLVIETQTDITGRENMRRELEQAHEQLGRIRDELERSNEELEEFARIASHDLGAPISSTRWLVDILRQRHCEQLSEEGQHCVDLIARGLERMADQIQGILSHARVGLEPITTDYQCDTGTAFSMALANLQGDIEGRGSKINHDPFPQVAVAPQALTQVFQNLLSNALKYCRPGVPPEIYVSVTAQDAMWLFGVRDNGIGIEAQWFERIFQPMQRLGRTDVAGSGIGLATCRKIVRRAGGRIWVESEVGSGSTFWFTLPAASGLAVSS